MKLRETTATLLFLAVAAINLAPGAIALAPERTLELYGITLEGDALVLLMRHRALLLAIVGMLLAVAAFVRSWRVPATVAGLLSMVTFVVMVAMSGAELPKLERVMWIDVGAVLLLVAAFALGRNRDPAA